MLGGGEHEAHVSKRWVSVEGRCSWFEFLLRIWACICLSCFGDLHLPIISLRVAHMAQ